MISIVEIQSLSIHARHESLHALRSDRDDLHTALDQDISHELDIGASATQPIEYDAERVQREIRYEKLGRCDEIQKLFDVL